ncbi:MAG: molybdopterin-dependent oxidoreductase [Deltaproteobacteria bacterium]|nr:molybdopterin-dependent oxidoreductase [Deltaproteobacteria bacterium]
MAKKFTGDMDRRAFLKTTGGLVATTAIFGFPHPSEGAAPAEKEYVPKDLRQWSQYTTDIYKSKFAYTRGGTTGFSPHGVNCKGNCAWQTFENEGRITREEQVANYPQIRPDIPDANPRGCNKGAMHSQSLYQEDRLLYPMKRAGERGEGKWKRITWDEAYTEIAEKLVDKVKNGDFGKVMMYAGLGVLSPLRRAAGLRFRSLMGSVSLNAAGPVGDMFPGATIVYGNSLIGTTTEAWYDADYLLIMAANPMVARLADSHYINEGKYKGNRVVTVCPDYNPTARASSLWVPIKIGTDSLFMASFNHALLKEKLYNEAFIKEQTDLPFLVKTENGKLLRQSDMVIEGKGDVFYFYDLNTSKAIEARGSMGSDEKTIKLPKGVNPAIEGTWTIKTSAGKDIKVTTAFEILKKELEKFPPEKTQKDTGINPSIVYEEARRFAKADKALIVGGYRTHKYYWGVLGTWGQALALALTGHGGRKGGLDIDNEWNLGNTGPLSSPAPSRGGSGFLGDWFCLDQKNSFNTHYDDKEFKEKVGMTKEEVIKLGEWAIKDGGFDYDGKPEIAIFISDNKFPRSAAQKQSQDTFLKQTEFIVDLNIRMSSTGHYADILLPTLANYESYELRMDPGYCRFGNVMVPPKGLKTPGEVKSEWDICSELCMKIEEVAKRKGVSAVEDKKFKDPKDDTLPLKRNLHTIYKDFTTVEGKTILKEKELFDYIVALMPAIKHQPIQKTVEDGFVVLNSEAGQTSPLYPDQPFYPNEPHVYLKKPYATTSGRQQFYVDYDLYLKMGCPVPTGKGPIRPSKYPLAFFDSHTRHGIHTNWRTQKFQQRLQRGVPYVCLNPATAQKKGIKDGDWVRVFNDVGDFKAMAKLSNSIPPDAVWTEHAWEDIQFEGGKGYNSPLAASISPLELVGKYGHMSASSFWDGNRIMGESSVDVRKEAKI